MVYEFKFPDVGEGITEGEIVKWLVKEGDKVKENDNIVQIETDKAVADVPSPKSGIILKIHFKEGEVIRVGETLVSIDEKDEKQPLKIVSLKKIDENKSAEKFSGKKSVTVIGELEEAGEVSKPVAQKSEFRVGSGGKVLALPRVRKLANKLGVDISKLKGSGSNGAVIEDDVINASRGVGVKKEATKIKISKKYDMWGHVDRIPLKGIRKTIANRMLSAFQSVAPVTSMIDVDVTKLWDVREKEKVKAEKKGIKLTFLAYIVKAVVESLKKYPYLNSTLEEDEIIIKKYYNIGVAVDTEAGLLVPVIKRAEGKSLFDIAKEIFELARKAKERKIDLMEMKGGSFTITNYGSIGGNYGTPIINYPESAILGVGRIIDRITLNNEKVENRKILPLSLTFDHRILDGAEAARFLVDVREHLENARRAK